MTRDARHFRVLRAAALTAVSTVTVFLGCATTSPDERIGPPETGNADRYKYTPIAVGMAAAGAAASRIAGGCFASCAYGTACNPNTGTCDPVPESQEPHERGAVSVPFGASPPYGLVDPSPPVDANGEPTPEIPRYTKEVDPKESPDVCALACKDNEYCGKSLDGAIACLPQGPLPDRSY
ncbi:MAG: hypothetical protein HOW73_39585 [Polyangiaceae bacterium]|nr:hypothetical protein [Polyangiaceae bacterium]